MTTNRSTIALSLVGASAALSLLGLASAQARDNAISRPAPVAAPASYVKGAPSVRVRVSYIKGRPQITNASYVTPDRSSWT